MPESQLDVTRRLLHGQGYALAPEHLAEACAHHPDAVCALLSAAGAIATTDTQVAALTDAANLLCDAHACGGADTVLSLRERLDRVADALTTALAERDKATARLRHTCQALASTDIPLISIPGDSNPAADQPHSATDPTP
ncbi:hypothetical protein [Micromonospora sp. NPDC050200]|uniref:hypothetical protein n=1 Tax=Micromonospora sp. NPDC050200 TaxID=3155664 RepID=UPI00340124D4